MKYHLIVIGGGAAGFFAAINYAELHPGRKILILEKSKEVLSKVKISGGGRCNVTHACFEPDVLVEFYPRGKKELLSCFHRFQPSDTIEWFAQHGVSIVQEADGRMFPQSNSSQEIINCFMHLIRQLNIELKVASGVKQLNYLREQEQWALFLDNTAPLFAQQILCATGSSPSFWDLLSNLNIKINKPVPSLFAFNCDEIKKASLPGLSVARGSVSCKGRNIKAEGPILITHKGLSGPSILKLSAFESLYFHQQNYKLTLIINWNTDWDKANLYSYFLTLAQQYPKQKVYNHSFQGIPSRLWNYIVIKSAIGDKNWSTLKKADLETLSNQVCSMEFEMQSKSTHKDEFVTCGGVALHQIDFKTMQHKTIPHLYFAGELLDIDGVTGGFNFQAAWTTAQIAANAMQ